MAGAGKDLNASQFYLTLGPDLDSLDGKHTIFGEVLTSATVTMLALLLSVCQSHFLGQGRTLHRLILLKFEKASVYQYQQCLPIITLHICVRS